MKEIDGPWAQKLRRDRFMEIAAIVFPAIPELYARMRAGELTVQEVKARLNLNWPDICPMDVPEPATHPAVEQWLEDVAEDIWCISEAERASAELLLRRVQKPVMPPQPTRVSVPPEIALVCCALNVIGRLSSYQIADILRDAGLGDHDPRTVRDWLDQHLPTLGLKPPPIPRGRRGHAGQPDGVSPRLQGLKSRLDQIKPAGLAVTFPLAVEQKI
jgi:hypothetical protein